VFDIKAALMTMPKEVIKVCTELKVPLITIE